jgi:BirA family biotin operon repressor/biotin-[acetyl-CoA-carboxylase] ligase
LLFGVAVAAAIEAVAPVSCHLKWPNDVWIDGRKVAGILMTARSAGGAVAHATLGIGINVNVPVTDLPPGAASLMEWSGGPIERATLLRELLAHCETVYRDFCADRGNIHLDAWRARAALLGDIVRVQHGEEVVSGILTGVSDDGALLLQPKIGGARRVVAGDLVRGPVAGDGPRSR